VTASLLPYASVPVRRVAASVPVQELNLHAVVATSGSLPGAAGRAAHAIG
jgi:hypothetical protein